MITSIFADFGSHLGIAELGGPIHNRAATFFVMGLSPRPGKPPHTTIPAIVTRQGTPEYALGLAGGYVQAQVQVQLLIHLLDKGAEPQDEIDAPRMRILFGGEIALEPGHPLELKYPDAVGRPTGAEGYGGAQVAANYGGDSAPVQIRGVTDPSSSSVLSRRFGPQPSMWTPPSTTST